MFHDEGKMVRVSEPGGKMVRVSEPGGKMVRVSEPPGDGGAPPGFCVGSVWTWIPSGFGWIHLGLDGSTWIWMDPSGFEWIHLGLGFGCCVDPVWVGPEWIPCGPCLGPEWALHAKCYMLKLSATC